MNQDYWDEYWEAQKKVDHDNHRIFNDDTGLAELPVGKAEILESRLSAVEWEQMKRDANREKFAPLFSSDKADWETPDWFFAALHDEFHFDVDVCASMENRKVDKFFSAHQDAFRLQWKGTCWMNPPYSTGIDKWLAKAKHSAESLGSTVVCLVPARTDTNWWFSYARFGEVRFLKGRLKFKGAPTSAPFPSALVIYRPGLPRSTSYWHYKEIKEPPGWEVRELR